MAIGTHQVTSVDTDRLILGNYKMETATSSGATFVNLGPGMLTSWQHNYTNSNIQCGNSVDPMEYIAEETLTFGFDMIEWDCSAISAIQGGLTETGSITSVISTLRGGGAKTITKRAFKFTNTQTIDDGTVETIITVFRASTEGGLTLGVKSDNDADPINVFSFSCKAENDTSLTAGAQLFTIQKTET